MKIAITSNDLQKITGKAGRARSFLVYEVDKVGDEPTPLPSIVLTETSPCFHDLHEDDDTPHPVDGMILITGEAGEGFRKRLARRGIKVYITATTDPLSAVKALMNGELQEVAPKPYIDGEEC